MKVFLKVLFVIISIFIITEACICIYDYYTRVDEDSTSVQKDYLFTLESYPKVDASLATQPLTNAFIKYFTGEENITDEYLDYTNTHPGYIRLIDGDVDLIVVTEPSEDELDYAKEKNVELEVIPVVREGFVFYVNKDNPVSELSLKEIQDIYSGKITNWKEIGGEDAEIRAFQRPENSGSQTGMLSLVMKDKKLMTPIKEDLVETMEEIIGLVSSYDNGLNSIGYSYYYYATTMFDVIDSEVADRIKLLAIDGIEPNNTTIKSEEYPLETAYYIVIRKDEPEESNTRKLVNAMLSKEGQMVAEEAGYVGVK